jgi:nitrite reductase/ring-hydroxylating ferredoxin subunit
VAKHVVGRVEDIKPGQRRTLTVRGRPVVVFNLKGEFFAMLNRCPHQSAELSAGIVTGLVDGDLPGEVHCSRPGEIIRCPWHGWEFDIKTGQSWCEPGKIAVKQYPVEVEPGTNLVKGPYVAETFPIEIEDDYVIVEV